MGSAVGAPSIVRPARLCRNPLKAARSTVQTFDAEKRPLGRACRQAARRRSRHRFACGLAVRALAGRRSRRSHDYIAAHADNAPVQAAATSCPRRARATRSTEAEDHRPAPAHRREDAGIKRRIPHFAYVEEIDMTELEEPAHASERDQEVRTASNSTLLPFLLRALVRVLPGFPADQCPFRRPGRHIASI